MPRKDKRRQRESAIGLTSILGDSWLNWLLVLAPVSIAIDLLGAPKLWLFATSAVAIVPLAGLIAVATEHIAGRVGPGAGGLLNATFGNAVELIIGIFALRAGLQEVVKASISGSIIGNILLVLGLSMFFGGWGRETQKFNRTRAGASAGMLFLAVVALVMPALFDVAVFGSLERQSPDIESLSLLVAAVLMITYVAGLVFALKTHRLLFASVPPEAVVVEQTWLSVRDATVLLVVATFVTAVVAELLVGTISVATQALGMTRFFVGVIIVAIVGNAAEHFSAVTMARKDKMDLALSIAAGSGIQIALFVAPVLIFVSLLFGQPMSLVFNAFEVVSITLAVIVLSIVSLDGESNWFEGVQLMAVYLVLAIVFYFVPSI